MLPIFCPPTIWAISLEFCRKPCILEADDLLGACHRKAVTPQKLWTLYFFPISSIASDCDIILCIPSKNRALSQKNPRAHMIKIKIGTPPPPKQTQNTPPPLKRRILWTWVFFCRKNALFPGADKIGAAISGPRIADKKFYGHGDFSDFLWSDCPCDLTLVLQMGRPPTEVQNLQPSARRGAARNGVLAEVLGKVLVLLQGLFPQETQGASTFPSTSPSTPFLAGTSLSSLPSTFGGLGVLRFCSGPPRSQPLRCVSRFLLDGRKSKIIKIGQK